MHHIPELFFKMFNDSIRFDVSENKTVVSCKSCEGAGFVSHEEMTDYHKRDYTTRYNECKTCAGCGRLTLTTTRIRLQARYPYDNIIQEIDTKVPYKDDPINQLHVNSWNEYATIPLTDMKVR